MILIMSIIYGRNLAPKHVLPIEMSIKVIFILTTSLIVTIVSYYVFPENSRIVVKGGMGWAAENAKFRREPLYTSEKQQYMYNHAYYIRNNKRKIRSLANTISGKISCSYSPDFTLL